MLILPWTRLSIKSDVEDVLNGKRQKRVRMSDNNVEYLCRWILTQSPISLPSFLRCLETSSASWVSFPCRRIECPDRNSFLGKSQHPPSLVVIVVVVFSRTASRQPRLFDAVAEVVDFPTETMEVVESSWVPQLREKSEDRMYASKALLIGRGREKKRRFFVYNQSRENLIYIVYTFELIVLSYIFDTKKITFQVRN